MANGLESTLSSIRSGGAGVTLADQISATRQKRQQQEQAMQMSLMEQMRKNRKAEVQMRKDAMQTKETALGMRETQQGMGETQTNRMNSQLFSASQGLLSLAQQNPQEAAKRLANRPKLAQALGVDPSSPGFVNQLQSARDKYRAAAEGAVPDTPSDQWRPVTPEERQAYNLPSDEVAQINEKTGKIETEGGQTINVGDQTTKFQSEVQENTAEQINQSLNEAQTAPSRLAQVQQMQAAIEGGAQTGFAGETRQVISQAMEMVGLDPDKAAPGLLSSGASTEVIDSASNQLAVEILNSQEGRTSRIELKTVKRAIPELSKTPEGNKIILNIMKNKAERDQAVGNIASVYSQTPQGVLTSSTTIPGVGKVEEGTTYSQAVAKYDADNPIINDELEEKIEKAGTGPLTIPRDNDGNVKFHQMRENEPYEINGKEYIFRGVKDDAQKPYTADDYLLDEK